MKPLLCSATITILFLVHTATGNAQDKLAGTEQSNISASALRPKEKKDSLKLKKKSKHKRADTDYAFNPYQPPAAPAKPLPYNSYREQPAPVQEGTGSNILRDIITEKVTHKKKN